MKKFLKIFIIIIVLGALAYQFQSGLISKFVSIKNNIGNDINVFYQKAPCSSPIPYTIGTFDTQFNISRADLLSAISEAEAIWKKPFGKDFFVYAPTDSNSNVLKINLIYDSRQQATSELSNIGIVVTNDKASYDSLKAKYTILQTQFTIKNNDYSSRVQNFNLEQSAYESQVTYWNAKGGAPKSAYDQLQSEKDNLLAESSQLQTEQTQINNMVTEINYMVVVLNQLADTLNLSVNKYNTVNSSLSESFEEGVYVNDGVNRYINIYEFSNHTKFVRVLAHELGHALGLDHVADPNAIMYKSNQGNSLSLTEDDINELKTKCGIK